MAEALYRKYRPQTFEDVVGQTHIERTLKNAIESDKVSHAYLFCGPRGTGKTTTARILAKALLCEHGPTPAPDGTCDQCLEIAEGTHPDVNELDAASRTGVENVREEIIGRVQYAPTRGRYKVYIIDEVHMLTTAAFNALLKTLEEPPSHVVFVLCTTDPQKVPETILSRCQRFDFHHLSNEEIVSRLAAVCEAEGVEYETPALELAASRARGGMRDALTALEQLIAFGNGAVTKAVAESVFGAVGADELPVLAGHIAKREAAACFSWLSEYVETGADLGRFVQELAAYMRNLYVLSLTNGAAAVDALESDRSSMMEQAALFGADRLAHILRVLGDTMTELRHAGNQRLSFEIALTRMVRPESDLTIEALAARVEALEKALASGACSQVSASPVACAPSAAEPSAAARPAASAPRSAVQADSAVQPAAPAQRSEAPAPRPARVPSSVSTPSSANAASAMNKVAEARAMFERVRAKNAANRPSQPAVSPRPASVAAPSQPAVPSSAASVAEASADVRAKLSDEASLNRCWQSTIAELKRQRAAYGALLLSARPYAAPDASKLLIEFPSSNAFAYSAACKPDFSAMAASALRGAFGGDVPFEVVKGEGAAPARSFARSASVPARQASPAFTPPVEEVVPYDDGDVVPYTDADAAYYAGEEGYGGYAATGGADPFASSAADRRPADIAAKARLDGSSESLADAVGTSAAASSVSSSRANDAVRSDAPEPSSPIEEASFEADLAVVGPKPVDPYIVGKELGFDSMPAPKKRRKGTFKPKGWPMPGDLAENPSARDSVEDLPSPEDAAGEGVLPEREPEIPAVSVSKPVEASPKGPNPFASRPMPAGIGGGGSASVDAPEASSPAFDGPEMDAFEIFGAFGVSPDNVREER